MACQALFDTAAARYAKAGHAAPAHLSQIVLGDANIGEQLVDDPRIALVSATGIEHAWAKPWAPRVAARFGTFLLELGGNNAIIVSDKADLALALERHFVWRGRHRRPALHNHAPRDRASIHL